MLSIYLYATPYVCILFGLHIASIVVCVRRCVVIATKFNIESNLVVQGVHFHDDDDNIEKYTET